MKQLINHGKTISCGITKTFGETQKRTFSQSTADGLNYITSGKIPDHDSKAVHLIMISATILIINKSTRNYGISLGFLILLLWAVGQVGNCSRLRDLTRQCN